MSKGGIYMSLLATRFREVASKSKDYRMKNEIEQDVAYPTGFLGFDFMNGTVIHVQSEDIDFKYNSVGVVDGSIVMVIGRAGCGKTTFTIQSSAEIIKPYPTAAIYHDNIEGGIIQSRLETLTDLYGQDLEDVYIARNSGVNTENVYERIKMIHDLKMANRAEYEYNTGLFDEKAQPIIKLEPTVYILDSLAMLMPDKLTEEETMSGQMSTTAAAKTNAQLFRRITPLLKAANIIFFVINHITEQVDISMFAKKKSQLSFLKQGETLPGGRTPIYLSNLLIRLDDNSRLKDSEGFGIAGSIVEFTLLKSRSSAAGNSINLVFDFNKGFDRELSLFQLLKEKGYVNGAGAYLYLGDHKEVKFAQKNFKAKLQESEELQQIFTEVAYKALYDLINKPVEKEDEENKFNITSAILNMSSMQKAA